MGQKLLFMGYRKGAIEAAKRLGIEADCVELSEVHTKARTHHSGLVRIFHCEDELWQELALNEVNSKRYSAIVALTEKMVPIGGRLREHLGISGMWATQSATCHFKDKMKKLACLGGIRTNESILISRKTSMEKVVRSWGWPLVVKERGLSGSRGLTICRDSQQLEKAWKEGKLVESFISGREMSIESFVMDGEVRFVNFTAYHRLLEMNLVPALFDSETCEQLAQFNHQVLDVFGINSGVTHLEVYLTREGIVFGELAVRPPGGYIFRLIKEAYGFDPWETLLQIELGLTPDWSSMSWQGIFAGAWIIHPGAGRFQGVKGEEKLKSIPQLEHFGLKVKPGQLISPRLGSGMEIGHAIFSGTSREEVVQAMESAKKSLQFQLEKVDSEEL